MSIVALDTLTEDDPVYADWANIVTEAAKAFLRISGPIQQDGTNVLKGSFFNIQGVPYYCSADTAISGTSSDYVYLIADGSTATPYFADDLDDVSWDSEYGGFYDSNGYYYILSEPSALEAGTFTTQRTLVGDLFAKFIGQDLKSTAEPTFGGLTLTGDYSASIMLHFDGSLTCNGGINPPSGDDYDSAGTYTVSASSNKVLSRGAYGWHGDTLQAQVNMNGSWYEISQTRGFVLADTTGATRLHNEDTVDIDADYRKF